MQLSVSDFTYTYTHIIACELCVPSLNNVFMYMYMYIMHVHHRVCRVYWVGMANTFSIPISTPRHHNPVHPWVACTTCSIPNPLYRFVACWTSGVWCCSSVLAGWRVTLASDWPQWSSYSWLWSLSSPRSPCLPFAPTGKSREVGPTTSYLRVLDLNLVGWNYCHSSSKCLACTIQHSLQKIV